MIGKYVFWLRLERVKIASMRKVQITEYHKYMHIYEKNTSTVLFPALIEAEWRIYASVNLASLVQIMACRLAGAKPSSEPMLEYC